jgi:hypothetical protein
VRKLRTKLEQISPGWRYVHTHFGVGYRFAAEPAGETGPGSPGGTASAAETESPAPGGSPVRRNESSAGEKLAAVR